MIQVTESRMLTRVKGTEKKITCKIRTWNVQIQRIGGGKDAFLKKKVRIHIGVKAFPFDAQLFQVEYEAVNLPQ